MVEAARVKTVVANETEERQNVTRCILAEQDSGEHSKRKTAAERESPSDAQKETERERFTAAKQDNGEHAKRKVAAEGEKEREREKEKEKEKEVRKGKDAGIKVGGDSSLAEGRQTLAKLTNGGITAQQSVKEESPLKRGLRQRPKPMSPKRQGRPPRPVSHSSRRKKPLRHKRPAPDPPPSRNLRRSKRVRRVPPGFGFYTSGEGLDCDGLDDEDKEVSSDGGHERQEEHVDLELQVSQDEVSAQDVKVRPKLEPTVKVTEPPRREGLRPRRGGTAVVQESRSEEEDEEEQDEEDGENGDGDQLSHEEDEDPEREEDGEGDEEDEGEGEEGEEGEEEEEDEEGDQGRRERRYALRNRTEVQRFSPRREERPARARSPRRMYPQGGNGGGGGGGAGGGAAGGGGGGGKRGREGRRLTSKGHKRHHSLRAEDSDDSLLVDEMDQGPAGYWGRVSRPSEPPWMPPGIEILGPSAWGLGASANGWGSHGDWLAGGVNQGGGGGGEGVSGGVGGQGGGKFAAKVGADVQPILVDTSVTFDQIGGLSQYINSLKEMVFFPLLYPQFFAKYHIAPPRGVLLCGPPGTGKTLVARALASTAARAGQKITFFMRKGADVLSKWVGEAERQLRMLFQEAQRCQPSIIFFDEIDGLAPVRSGKQEQIHNSIVSTLLALMDGLDSRGQVVVIGATNRIDAIDGALRRPGRFDREFFFSLPDVKARTEILGIHTRNWKDPPSESLRKELAQSSVGYCGADMKALCTEAAIRAFRMKYPQVYESDEQFVIDVDSIRVERRHFLDAMKAITPAAHRSAVVHARPLPPWISPCLESRLGTIMEKLKEVFPPLAAQESEEEEEEEEEDEREGDGMRQLTRFLGARFGTAIPFLQRPRLLLCGKAGAGQDYLGPAVLHELEKFPVHSLGLPSLLADASAKIPEEALVHVIGEARKTAPAVLFLPHLQLWWETAHDQLRATLLMLLSDLPSALPVLLLATAEVPEEELDKEARAIFGHNVYTILEPTDKDRDEFFRPLTEAAMSVPRIRQKKLKEKRSIPNLPKVPAVEKGPSLAELQSRIEAEEHGLRRLRMCLRDVCNRLLHEKRFSMFHYPVLDDDAPDYEKVVEKPMDVTALLQRVDSGLYLSRAQFLQDVDLIPANAKAYNGDDYHGARIVSKACALRDAVHGMLSQMDPSLVVFCDKIVERGGPLRPPFQTVAPPAQQPVGTTSSGPLANQSAPGGSVTRASARLRGVQPEVDLSVAPEALLRQKRRSSDACLQEGPATTNSSPCSESPPIAGRTENFPGIAKNISEKVSNQVEPITAGGASEIFAVEPDNVLMEVSPPKLFNKEGKKDEKERKEGNEGKEGKEAKNGKEAREGKEGKEEREGKKGKEGKNVCHEGNQFGDGNRGEFSRAPKKGEPNIVREKGEGDGRGMVEEKLPFDLNVGPIGCLEHEEEEDGMGIEGREREEREVCIVDGISESRLGTALKQREGGVMEGEGKMRERKEGDGNEKEGRKREGEEEEGRKGEGEEGEGKEGEGEEGEANEGEEEEREALHVMLRQRANLFRMKLVVRTAFESLDKLEALNGTLWRVVNSFRKNKDRNEVFDALEKCLEKYLGHQSDSLDYRWTP